jgi:hypothetical protein
MLTFMARVTFTNRLDVAIIIFHSELTGVFLTGYFHSWIFATKFTIQHSDSKILLEIQLESAQRKTARNYANGHFDRGSLYG